jgi:hypothetical protein
MRFDLPRATEILERTPGVFRSMLAGLSTEWTQPNEGPDTFSAFDNLGHVIHGERADWIPRARIILAEGADRRFEPFDRFAQNRESAGKTLGQLLDEFEVLRRENLAVLRSWNLTGSQLALKGVHPAFGEVTLENLLATWVVHDLGHIAQTARVIAKQYKEEVGPWKAYLPVLHRGGSAG